MKVVELDATKLKVHGVTRISLVDQASNKHCIKVIKEDTSMKPDVLGGLFGNKAKVPTLAGVYIPTSMVSAAEQVAVDNGLVVTDKSEAGETDSGEGITLIRFEGDHAEVEHVLKMDEVAAVVSVDKSFTSWPTGGTFQELMATTGFFPGVQRAFEVASDLVYDSVYASYDAPPIDELTKVLDDLKSYILGLAGGIPAVAYKFDKVQQAGLEDQQDDSPQGAAGEDIDTGSATDNTPTDEGVVDDPNTQEDQTVKETPPTDTKPEPKSVDKETNSLGVTAQQLSDVTAQLKELASATTALKSDLDKLKHSTVGGTPLKDPEVTHKSDQDNGFGELIKFPGFE